MLMRGVWCAQCKEKPQGDKYGFTHFARMLNRGKGLAPLPSDSRRRADRAALEVPLLLLFHICLPLLPGLSP
jgi:hypothetical protein